MEARTAIIVFTFLATTVSFMEGEATTLDIRELLRAARRPQSAERRNIPQALAEIFAEALIPPNADPVQTEARVKSLMKALLKGDSGAVNTQLQDMVETMAAGNRPWTAAGNASAILSSVLLGLNSAFPTTLSDKETRFIDLARDLVSTGSAAAFQDKVTTTVAPLTTSITNTMNTITNTAGQLANSISGAISSITLKPPTFNLFG